MSHPLSRFRPVTPPMPVFDPAIMLATGVHAQPGVYALLLGSGVSTGAGIPTGWGVVQDLIRRAAAAQDPDDESAPQRAAADPEAWWAEHGDGQPLGYSNLLGALASMPAARRGLLAGFFEPSGEDLEAGLKVPGPVHRAIAELVRRGSVRVIVTTNFDRLVERALEDAGVSPQVISRPDAVAAMTPLVHAPATVIKLHGDYADLMMRNTVEELDAYPTEWTRLLGRVFDEYGLLISGWSAEWDKALVRALETVKPRRYPMFWDSRSSRGEAASRLRALHGVHIIKAVSADDLFTRLSGSIHALERLAEPPLTTAIALVRLKRFLPDPVRRIDLHDLVMGKALDAAKATPAIPTYQPNLTAAGYQDVLAEHLNNVNPTLQLLATGISFDRGREHTDLWVKVVQRLLQARSVPNGAYSTVLDSAQHYPALLALRACGVAALLAGYDDVLLRLLVEPKYRDLHGNTDPLPAVHALHPAKVIPSEEIKHLPRWGATRWPYPSSHLLRADLRELFRSTVPLDADYNTLHNQFEYRVACVVEGPMALSGVYRAPEGEYLGDGQWLTDGRLHAEAEFAAYAEQQDASWPWWQYLGGGPAGLQGALGSVREVIKRYQRWQ